MNQAFTDVLNERRRQVDEKGYNSAHDDAYARGELALAGAAYAGVAAAVAYQSTTLSNAALSLYPWRTHTMNRRDLRSDLVRGAALIVAEIEAIDRAADADPKNCPVCDMPLQVGDVCATDIELGTCHSACLYGSPVVDLETGEEVGGETTTFRYGEDK